MSAALLLTLYALLWFAVGGLVILALHDLVRIWRGLKSKPLR